MTVFKSFFLAARRFLWPVIIYVGLMVLMTGFIMASIGDNPGQLQVSTDLYKVAVINRGTGAEITTALTDFLGERSNIISINSDEKSIRDALFWRDVDYVLELPEGFEESVLSGEQPQLKTYNSPNDYVRLYVDQYVNRFLATYLTYQQRLGDKSTADLLQMTTEDLKSETKIQSVQQESSNHAQTSMAWYFRFLSYPMMAAIATGMGMVLSRLMSDNLSFRNRVSSFSDTRRNLQVLLASLLYAALIWLVLLILGLILTKLPLSDLFTPRFLLMLLSSFLYMAICMAVALLITSFTQKSAVVTAVVNVVGLGSSFLGGVFVPVEVMGNSILRIGRAFPAYWYTSAVRAVGEAAQMTQKALSDYWSGMGILTLMLAVLLSGSLLVNKVKRQRGIG